MKNWIFKRFFKHQYKIREKEKEELYRKAFFDASKDLEETNLVNIEEKGKELAEKMLLEMMSIVDYNKVVSVGKQRGILYAGKEEIDIARLANLKAEADFLVESELWKFLSETPKELAHQSLFKNSESLDDLKKGKAMLYTLSAQQNIIDIIRSFENK